MRFPLTILLSLAALPCPADEPVTKVLEGADAFRFDPRLADLFDKIDPAKAGWDSEVFQDAAKKQLGALCELIEGENLDSPPLRSLATEIATARGFTGGKQPGAFRLAGATVWRANTTGDAPLADALAAAFRPLAATTDRRHAVKIERVTLSRDALSAVTEVRVQIDGKASNGTRLQFNQRWKVQWSREEVDAPPLIASVELLEGTVVQPEAGSDRRVLFEDATVPLLGRNPSFAEQLAWPYDHWRARSDRLMGTDFTSNQGVAVADVDGDGLDDLFLSQPGGLPNRLYRHLPDGSTDDVSASYGLDYLDFTRTALFLDFDNDGDQDAVIGLSWHLIFLRNDGPKPDGGIRFTPHFRAACPGMVYALAAADYDGDGDLDIYASGRYAHNSLASERQVLGVPVPYHDANNGGRSTLWRNEGNLEFKDVTREVGLDRNNTRFTLAAAWEDYDNDGDQDLYVANDFGRNNLYRNDGGKFTDVAREAGVEDIGAGMSVAWGDYDNDGHMDIYVSNMYSSAGHRIASQARFMDGVDKNTLAAFMRHARGNSLFRNRGDGTFEDTTMSAGVNMGRWAWSSNFVDLDNDGRRDLVVANGFITAEGTDDL